MDQFTYYEADNLLSQMYKRRTEKQAGFKVRSECKDALTHPLNLPPPHLHWPISSL